MKLADHGDFIHTSAFSPTDPLLITSGFSQGEIRLWDTHTGKNLGTLAHHPEVTNFTFNQQGILAYVAGDVIYLWNLHSRTLVRTIPCEAGSAIAWGPDDKILAVGADHLSLVDSLTGNIQQQLEGAFTDGIMTIAWHPTGKTIAAGGSLDSPRLTLWDVNQDTHRTITSGLAGNTEAIVFTALHWITCLQDYGCVYVWDSTSNDLKLVFDAGNKAVDTASIRIDCDGALSPSGQLVAYGQTTGIKKKVGAGISYEPIEGHPMEALYITDVHTGNDLAIIEGHAEPISHMAFSPDGRLLATADFGGALYLWDLTILIPPVSQA